MAEGDLLVADPGLQAGDGAGALARIEDATRTPKPSRVRRNEAWE
jgi:hypothetical protein